MLWHDFKNRLRRFRDDERGSMIVEGVLAMPMMFWVLITFYVFWDAYRSITVVQKATYSIADVVSRRRAGVDAGYLDGLNTVMNFLLDSGQTADMRFSSVTWNGIDNRYEVEWSYSPNGTMAALSTGDAGQLTSQLPIMADGDTILVIETSVEYQPAFNLGVLGERTIEKFIVIRPRLVPRVCFAGVPCGVLNGGTASGAAAGST